MPGDDPNKKLPDTGGTNSPESKVGKTPEVQKDTPPAVSLDTVKEAQPTPENKAAYEAAFKPVGGTDAPSSVKGAGGEDASFFDSQKVLDKLPAGYKELAMSLPKEQQSKFAS